MSNEKVITPENVNQQDEYGNTPLHYAALNGSTKYYKNKPDFEMIEKLLSLGADITLKNHSGLTAGDLIWANGYQSKETGHLGKNMTVYLAHKKTYTDLVIKYQPTAKNICCLLESEVVHPTNIPVCQLSQDCLENLIIWCQNSVKIYKNNRIKNAEGGYILNNVPKHLHFIENIQTLQTRCTKELERLEKYAHISIALLEETLTKIVDPRYQEAIMTALIQDEEIKSLFDSLIFQLNELPLSHELKESLQELNTLLEKQIEKNYPQFICLNEEGKKLVDSLFEKLYEIFHLPQMESDVNKTMRSSTRWKNDDHDFFVECSQKYKPEHQQHYQSVLSQMTSSSSSSSTSSTSSASSNAVSSNSNTETALEPTREEIRRKCAEAAEKRFSS